jgi:flavin reductase (DIM6/NTAB) family NADH-FMN oxidoreductase RutF
MNCVDVQAMNCEVIDRQPAAWGETDIAPKALRQVLGSYPTGVAIVTTRAAGGRPVGLTINSFASLSLEPALVLWSLVDKSPSLAAFRDAPHFAISVLADHQHALAQRFATAAVPDKFDGVALREAPEGLPVIEGALATLVCAVERHTPAGDHLLFVGRVRRIDRRAGEPLVFHGGRFAAIARAG